ncbi:MAG: hypothetical protein ACREKG_14980 [Candidatus Rokuibacteriota bacterium]
MVTGGLRGRSEDGRGFSRDESREARDAVLGTPMEQGVAEAYDKLAELVK